jgi:undecaprenyl diphosphate synthase
MSLINKPRLQTVDTPEPARGSLPVHVAIIMDGNGRWARQRHLPRIAGHKAGVESVRATVKSCARRGVDVLTLFAFSSENWRRPQREVSLLMQLLLNSIRTEVASLHENNVRLRFVGDRSVFKRTLVASMAEAERLTAGNTGLRLVIAVNYGGRWDIEQAVRALAADVEAGGLAAADVDAAQIEARLSLHGLPEPDLFIRTGGEQRISNFTLWHLAYTELYFTDTLWPDFDETSLDEAFASYASRQRRFGRTGDQIDRVQGA